MASGSGGFPALRAIPGAVDSEAAGGGGHGPDTDLAGSSAPTLAPPQLRRDGAAGLASTSDARVEAAIAASGRAEASLSGLFRAIEHLSNGVGGAREANELLTQELEILREMLGKANEQYLASKHKASLLEQTLERARRDAERDRAFLIDQHDAFIVDLMDEHDGSLERQSAEIGLLRDRLTILEQRNAPTTPPPSFALRDTVAEVRPPSGLDLAEHAELERTAQKLSEDRERAREAMQRLQGQRDEAQRAVERITQERDEALRTVHQLKSELGGPRLPHSTKPPSVESRRPAAVPSKPPVSASKSAEPVLALDQVEIDARLSRPPTAGVDEPRPSITSVLEPPPSKPSVPSMPLQVPHFSPPPEELRQALTISPSLLPRGATSSRPPLKQKPDPSTRPLVGYSVGHDEIEAERFESLRPSARPKSTDKP